MTQKNKKNSRSITKKLVWANAAPLCVIKFRVSLDDACCAIEIYRGDAALTDLGDMNTKRSFLQMIGLVAIAVALVFVVKPTLLETAPPAPDLFEAIERHVRPGIGIFLGLTLVAAPWRRPWSVLFAWVLVCLSGGYLVARFIGMALQGINDSKQWQLVGLELAVGLAAAGWIYYKRDTSDRTKQSAQKQSETL